MNNPELEGYDIIGDVHGSYQPLVKLLRKLGYEKKGEAYAYLHNKRQLIFVGDLIDRGPEIEKTLSLVKACCENGSAQVVIGNHEFNAIAYFTKTSSGYLRDRNERNSLQLAATLRQFEGRKGQLETYLNWFKTLPLFLDLPEFRVVHACWDQAKITAYQERFATNCITTALLDACAEGDTQAISCIRRLTRGINLTCPNGVQIKGQDGLLRCTFRAMFWSQSVPATYQEIVFQPDPLPFEVSSMPVSDADLKKMIYYSSSEKPLFVGHYWLTGEPQLVANNIACLDYSAVSGGQLVAYRYQLGDHGLDQSQFVAVENSLPD